MQNILCLMVLILLCNNQTDAICRLRICFTWKISITKLTLVCKIEHIDHIVSLVNNKQEEIADCHPTGISKFSCVPHATNISVSIKENSITVLFTGSIDEHVNGIWTCKHGSSLTNASVEVTVLYNKNQTNNVVLSSTSVPDNSKDEKRPLSGYIISPFVGFIIGVIFTGILKCVKEKIPARQSNCCDTIDTKLSSTGCLKNFSVFKRRGFCFKSIVTISLFVLLSLMIVIFYPNEQRLHNEGLVLFCGLLGIIFGVMCVQVCIKEGAIITPPPNIEQDQMDCFDTSH